MVLEVVNMKIIFFSLIEIIVTFVSADGSDLSPLGSRIVNGNPPTENMRCLGSVRNRLEAPMCSATFINMKNLICPARCLKFFCSLSSIENELYIHAYGKINDVGYIHINKYFKDNKSEELPPNNNIGFIAVKNAFSEGVVPAILPTEEEAENIQVDSELQLLGWHFSPQRGRCDMEMEVYVKVKIVELKHCKKKFNLPNLILFKRKEFCGRTAPLGTHFNVVDKGAPLLQGNMVIGFLSFGDETSPNSAALYTDVFEFIDYIEEQKAIAEKKLTAIENADASPSANTNANINANKSTGGSTSRHRRTNKIKNMIFKYKYSNRE